jgi:hypothetical protein
VLKWLWEEGHSRECRELLAALPEADEVDPAGFPVFVWSHRDELQTSQLLAWDLCRLIQVPRWGYTADYLEEDDAWSWILHAAQKLQRSFRSWEATGQNFLLGYEFWIRLNEAPDDPDWRRAYEWLVSDPESPWNQLPWNTTLAE